MTPDQTSAAISKSLVALQYILDVAARRLASLGQTVMVAACPNTNDDMGHSVDWLGVQVSNATWERTDNRTVIEEFSGSHGLTAAREVLDWLQQADWRLLAERALDLQFYDEVLAIIVQHEASWFVVSASNAGTDFAYLLGPAGVLTWVGAAERLDQRLGRTRPLLLNRIEPAAWPTLRDAVPAFPTKMSPATGHAEMRQADELTILLRRAMLGLPPLPDGVRYVATADSDPEGPTYGSGPWRTVAVNKNAATVARWGNEEWYANRLKQEGAVAETLNGMLDVLEKGKWRDLFAHAVVPLERNEPLGVLLHGTQWWLIASQSAVFAPSTSGGFKLVGACDRIQTGHDVAAAVLHFFDGTFVLCRNNEGPPVQPQP